MVCGKCLYILYTIASLDCVGHSNFCLFSRPVQEATTNNTEIDLRNCINVSGRKKVSRKFVAYLLRDSCHIAYAQSFSARLSSRKKKQKRPKIYDESQKQQTHTKPCIYGGYMLWEAFGIELSRQLIYISDFNLWASLGIIWCCRISISLLLWILEYLCGVFMIVTWCRFSGCHCRDG